MGDSAIFGIWRKSIIVTFDKSLVLAVAALDRFWLIEPFGCDRGLSAGCCEAWRGLDEGVELGLHLHELLIGPDNYSRRTIRRTITGGMPMAPRYAPAIFPALASSRIKQRRLAKVRLIRADRSIRVREAKALQRKFGRVWAEAKAWAESLTRP
jgi:hypothetical protein